MADYNQRINVVPYSRNGLTRNHPDCCVVNCNNSQSIYAFHSGGANAVRADGSVTFIKETITPGVLGALVTKAGGEVVQND